MAFAAGTMMARGPCALCKSQSAPRRGVGLRARPQRLRATAAPEASTEAASEGSTAEPTPPAPTPAPAAPAPEAPKEKKVAPLARGGTLSGGAAAGKEPGTGVVAATASQLTLQVVDGKFSDYRWKEGRWDLSLFAGKDGKTNWDSVIDAEMARRKMLEDSPIPSINEDPVNFDTSEIPWWAWVRRFHLPEAEKLNGRAAMMGYLFAWIVDSLSGAGLVDQQNSFLGKLALHVVVFAVLLFRNLDAIPAYKNLLDEATFYDKQWAATWEGQKRPSETES